MTTKIDIINKAYRRGRISGLTSGPTPEDISIGLDELEDMAHEWAAANICTGYNFEESPDSDSTHNIPRKYWTAYDSNLMMRLLAYFGKDITPALASTASTSFSRMCSDVAVIPELDYSSRMPTGSGNNRWNRRRRYYCVTEQVPIECETVKMFIDDRNDFYEDFTSYLNESETLSSFTIEADDGLTINSSSIPTDSNRVIYNVTADGNTGEEYKTLFQVKVVATTSDGRIETRMRNFELTEVDIG